MHEQIEKADKILDKLLKQADEYVDYSIQKKQFNKDIAEAISMVLAVAYGKAHVMHKDHHE